MPKKTFIMRNGKQPARYYLEEYYNNRLEELLKEKLGPEAYEEDYVGNLAQDKADYIAEHSAEIYAELAENMPVFKNDPGASEDIKARWNTANASVETLADHYIRHAMVKTALGGGEEIGSTEMCLFDFSGTPESFQKNKEIKRKLQGNIVDRTEIMTQRLGAILNTDLTEVDLTNPAMMPDGIRALDAVYDDPAALYRISIELQKMGLEFSDREEFTEYASRMSFIADMADIAQDVTDLVADTEYVTDGMPEIPNPSNSVLLDKKLKLDERRQKYFEEFDAFRSDYSELAPIDPDMITDFVGDIISEASSEIAREQNAGSPEQKEPEAKKPETKEMSFLTPDGKTDVRRNKLYQNLREIQKVFPDFRMSDEEADAMLSEKRVAIHQKAIEAQKQIEQFDYRNYVGDYKFPGNSYSVGEWLIDPSGTPEAKEHNRKVMRAFDRSTENMADKAEIFAEALNRVVALDEKKLNPPTPLEERIDYIIEHSRDLMLAWGIRRGLTESSLFRAELGVNVKPEMAKKLDLIGNYGEAMGGAKGLLSYAASEDFFTVPDKLTFEQLSVAASPRFTPIGAVLGFAPMQDHPSMEEIRKIKIDPSVDGSFFQPKETSYGRVPLNDLTLVRKELETLTAEFSAAGSKDWVMFGNFSRVKDALNGVNEAFAEADKGAIITKEASDKLGKQLQNISVVIYAYRREVEKSTGKQNVAAAVVKIADLLRDFGSNETDFPMRISHINSLRKESMLSDERLQQIDQLAALLASQDIGSADKGGVENFVTDRIQWNLNPADTTGLNYGRMKDFTDAIIKWNVENTKAMGKEAMRIAQGTGMAPEKAAYFASCYSVPGRKHAAITNALDVDKLDSDDFARMCTIFGIETDRPTLIRYIGEQTGKAQEALLSTLTGEEKEAFRLGMLAGDQNIGGYELTAKEGRYMVGYAQGQQEKCLEQVPETVELPSFAAFRDDVKSAASVGTELLGIDSKLHINSGDFRKLKEAVEKMTEASKKMEKADIFGKMDPKVSKEAAEAMEAVTKAAETYLTKRWKDRSTDIGKARFAKVAELLSTISPERAAIAEKKINLNRNFRDLEPVNFPQIPRNPRPLPPTPHAEPWLPTPEQTVQREVNSSVRTLIGRVDRALNQKQTLYRDDVELPLAEIMLQDMAKRNPEKNCFYSEDKFRNEARKIAKQPEFKEAVKGATEFNLQNLLRSDTLGATIAKKYLTNLEKTRASQKDSFDKSRQNIRENAPTGRSRSGSMHVPAPKKPGNDGPMRGGM